MSSYISQELKNQIEKADHHRCCYCLTSENNSGIPMTFDHIYPVSNSFNLNRQDACATIY